jgi:inosine/xanthosine triphosphate pyrophosphatase family protein
MLLFWEGKLEGEITTEELGDNGFGYGQYICVGDKTYAENGFRKEK